MVDKIHILSSLKEKAKLKRVIEAKK